MAYVKRTSVHASHSPASAGQLHGVSEAGVFERMARVRLVDRRVVPALRPGVPDRRDFLFVDLLALFTGLLAVVAPAFLLVLEVAFRAALLDRAAPAFVPTRPPTLRPARERRAGLEGPGEIISMIEVIG